MGRMHPNYWADMGRMHSNYWQITILLVVDLCSSLGYFMMTQPLPIAGKLPIKTLVARQLPTNTHTHTHTHTHRRVHTVVAEGGGMSSQLPHSSNVLPADGLRLGHSSLP